MTAPSRRPVRRRSGCGVLAFILVGGVALLFGVTWLFQWIDAPWSFEALGPTLTGTWEGPLHARLGAEYRIVLDVGYEAPGRSRTNLRGTARICNRQGRTYELALRGSANRSGDRVTIFVVPPGDDRPGPSLTLEGAWTGQVLTLQPTSNPFLPDGTYRAVRTISTDDPDDSFRPAELRKADRSVFEAACRRLTT